MAAMGMAAKSPAAGLALVAGYEAWEVYAEDKKDSIDEATQNYEAQLRREAEGNPQDYLSMSSREKKSYRTQADYAARDAARQDFIRTYGRRGAFTGEAGRRRLASLNSISPDAPEVGLSGYYSTFLSRSGVTRRQMDAWSETTAGRQQMLEAYEKATKGLTEHQQDMMAKALSAWMPSIQTASEYRQMDEMAILEEQKGISGSGRLNLLGGQIAWDEKTN